MSLEGKVAANKLRGRISKLDVIYVDTYEIAVRNGYKGTVEEWLASLKPAPGKDYLTEAEKKAMVDAVLQEVMKNNTSARVGYVELPADSWVGDASPFSQVVEVAGVTENSQVDLTPSVEQLAIFHNKDLAFVTENDGGVVTVYAIGQKPTLDYTIQVTITEVKV